MAIATGVILGLLIIGAGSALTSLIGLFLIGFAKHLTTPVKTKPGTGLYAGVLAVLGVLFHFAGPLASLWAGIATFVHFLGA